MKRWLFFLGTIVLLLVLQLTAVDKLLLTGPILQGPYIHQILMLVGINIILAVSLNLINGFTGQFSIGHAGFFAVGAYTSAFVIATIGPSVRGILAFLPSTGQDAVLLLIGILDRKSVV